MFDFSFSEVLADLGQFTAFEIANEARPASRYLFNTLLPETSLPDYSVETGHMTITPTMAGLSAESSPYPKGGHISVSKFLERTAKIANDVSLGEGQLRKLQSFMQRIQAQGQATNEFLVTQALNFLNKVILQAHIDAMEWLRAQALTLGEIDWTYGNQKLVVDYGFPADHLFAQRTGTSAYDGSASVFWDDIRLAQEKLQWNIRAIIAHPSTIFAIVGNSANNLEIISQNGGVFTLRRIVGSTERQSTDARDTIQMISYGEGGEIIDPADPTQTVTLDFMPTGKILVVANNQRSAFRIGEGATDDPNQELALGYTHIGPTVEGGGTPGRWARLYTPESRPWMLTGQGVTNGLPVIEAEKKIVVLNTTLG